MIIIIIIITIKIIIVFSSTLSFKTGINLKNKIYNMLLQSIYLVYYWLLNDKIALGKKLRRNLSLCFDIL